MSEVKVNKISPRTNCGTVTLGDSGDTITIPASATQTGVGRQGTVDWDTTAKTASFTAVSGNGYFVDTTSEAITVTLPAGSAGNIISLKDYANTWDTNNVTLTPNGTDKINGSNGNAILTTEDQSVTILYVDSTKGWRVIQDSTSSVDGQQFISASGGTETTSGNFKIHTFTGPGTFTVSSAGNSAGSNSVSYLVIAGGGGGGATHGGGGGAGGFREGKASSDCYTASPLNAPAGLPVTAQAYPITVGGGGAGAPVPSDQIGCSGNNSVFSTITSAGGGGAGGGGSGDGIGLNGGSGGGGGNTTTSAGGSGNTPPVSPPQGQNGGAGNNPGGTGGGGGAGLAGADSPGGNTAGNGGAGATTSINGTPTARAGGGGGSGGSQGSGGSGGGANGGSNVGTANTGGGGGGGGSGGAGGAGGSGIVIIRYKFQ